MAKKKNVDMMAFSICIQTGWQGGRNIPVLLLGAPGTGKTQVQEQIGKLCEEYLRERDLAQIFKVILEPLPQVGPETLEGIPAPDFDKKVMDRYPMKHLRELADAQWGIWCGDEYTSTTGATGGAAMTLIQDGRAGDITLPHTVARVLCGNPPECAAAGRDLSFPEMNRVCVLHWTLPMQDWFDYLNGGKGLLAHAVWLPDNWEQDNIKDATLLVEMFCEKFPKYVNTIDSGITTKAQEGESWASQRAWENFIRLLAASFSIGESASSLLVNTFARGLLGEGVAAALAEFIREVDMPRPGDILKVAADPNSTPQDIRDCIPNRVWDRPDLTRIMLESVADFAQRAPEDLRVGLWEAAFRVIDPVLDSKPDNAMAAAERLMEAKPPGATTPREAHKLFKARQAAGLLIGKRRKVS